MAVGPTLGAAVAGVAVLRNLGTKPLWRDEAISVSVAVRPATRILAILPHHDANASLYYLLLHAWLRLGIGHGPAAARGLSAICFAATAALASWAANRWWGWEAGVACGLLVAFNPFLLYYGQEARPYALAVLLAAVSTVALFWRPDGAAPKVYTAATVALVYADLFAVLYVVAVAAVVVAFCRARHRVQPQPRALTRSWGIIAAATAPLALLMTVFERGQIGWLPPPSVQKLRDTVTAMTGGWLGLEVVVVLAAVALIAGGGRRDRTLLTAMAVAFAGPPLVLWSFSQVAPAYVDRYVICSTLAMVVLATAGLDALRRVAHAVVAVAVLGGLLALGGRRIARIEARPYKVENAPAVVAFIAARDQPGDVVGYAGGGMRILIESAQAAAAGRPFPSDVALAPRGEEFLQPDLYAKEVTPGVLLSRLGPVRRIWLLTNRSDNRYPLVGPFASARSQVESRFHAESTTSFGTMDVTLLVRQP